MVNSKFSFYLVYFKAAIYVFINFLLFRLRNWEGLGGWEILLFHDFLIENLKSILMIHFSVRDELNMSLGKR